MITESYPSISFNQAGQSGTHSSTAGLSLAWQPINRTSNLPQSTVLDRSLRKKAPPDAKKSHHKTTSRRLQMMATHILASGGGSKALKGNPWDTSGMVLATSILWEPAGS